MDPSQPAPPPNSRPGRPRRGTETERADALISAATRVFLRDGYGLASIDKVASEAGASTRTIYERFKNKAELLTAVICRLVDRDLANEAFTVEWESQAPRQALALLGSRMLRRLREPDTAALYRILACEAHRFPELVDRMQCATQRLELTIAAYLRGQAACGTLLLADPDSAATLLLQMLLGTLRERVLFGDVAHLTEADFALHLDRAVDLFLNGALPRPDAGAAAVHA
jgi:AcrR family transcriptional regulator